MHIKTPDPNHSCYNTPPPPFKLQTKKRSASTFSPTDLQPAGQQEQTQKWKPEEEEVQRQATLVSEGVQLLNLRNKIAHQVNIRWLCMNSNLCFFSSLFFSADSYFYLIILNSNKFFNIFQNYKILQTAFII